MIEEPRSEALDEELTDDVRLAGEPRLSAVLGRLTEDLEPLADGPLEGFLDQLTAAVSGATVGDELAERRRRRRVGVALVTAAVVGLGATGAAAANGSLPDPIQDVVSDVANAVGITLPAGSQDGPGHGRSDEAPGRPEDPGSGNGGQGGRSDEAPGRSDERDQGNGQGTPPEDPGQGTPPEDPGRPEDPGQGTPPEDPGRPEDPGQGTPPEDPGRPEDPGQGNPNGGNSGNTPGATAPGRGG